VEGPVMIFLTTTAVTIDEELLNRCLVLTVDENREQTRAIHHLQRQRETIEGLFLSQEKDRIEKLHKNAQRLLRPLLVANPFAERLTFLDDKTRTRRDHVKYLTLIRAVALLHQYQRPVKRVTRGELVVEYIEATLEDVAVANELSGEVLGRSLDELPPQTRRLLSLVHRGGRGQSFVYELLYDGKGEDGRPFMPGLIDAGSLARTDALDDASLDGRVYDPEKSGVMAEKSGPGRPQVGGVSGGGRGLPMPLEPAPEAPFDDVAREISEKSLLEPSAKTQPHTHPKDDGGNGHAPETLRIAATSHFRFRPARGW
jgi:hypothetical protein